VNAVVDDGRKARAAAEAELDAMSMRAPLSIGRQFPTCPPAFLPEPWRPFASAFDFNLCVFRIS